MPIWIAIPLGLILLLIMATLNTCERYNISNIKGYIKDDTIEGYNLIFKLVNNDEISVTTTIEEFNKIITWYENDEATSYSIKDTCCLPNAKVSGKYVNLNKVNIVEFSYTTITNKSNILNPIMYLLTYPVPRGINVFRYAKGLFLIPLILIVYEKYFLNLEIKNILSNETMINYIFNTTINFVTTMFVLCYIILFMQKLLGVLCKDNHYEYEVKSQMKNKFYTYASFNFVVIGYLAYALKSIGI